MNRPTASTNRANSKRLVIKYSQEDANKLRTIEQVSDMRQPSTIVAEALRLLSAIFYEDGPNSEIYLVKGGIKKRISVPQFLAENRDTTSGTLNLTLDIKLSETHIFQVDELVNANLDSNRSKVVRLAISVLYRLVSESQSGWSLIRLHNEKPLTLFHGVKPVMLADEVVPSDPLATKISNPGNTYESITEDDVLKEFETRRNQISETAKTDGFAAYELLMSALDRRPLSLNEQQLIKEIISTKSGPRFSYHLPADLARTLLRSPVALADPNVVRISQDLPAKGGRFQASFRPFVYSSTMRQPPSWCPYFTELCKNDPLSQLARKQ